MVTSSFAGGALVSVLASLATSSAVSAFEPVSVGVGDVSSAAPVSASASGSPVVAEELDEHANRLHRN